MFKRTLIFAAAFAVFVGAIIIILAIIDVISFQELRQSLRKLLAVIVVSAIAILLLQKLFMLATQRSQDKNHKSRQISGPSSAKEDEEPENKQV